MSDSGWEFFTRAELQCKCGCGMMVMDNDFMRRIVAMRRDLGFPFRVSSAYRCHVHNAKVSSTGNDGPHTTGRAIDILVSGHQAHALVECAYRHGILGIGVSQKGPHESRFIHLDTVTNGPRPWLWTY